VADVHAPPDPGTTFDQLVALCEPARRDLYFFVAGRGDWVSRGEAAAALGLRQGLVAHHLDRLADDGLLDVAYRRLTGRSGPGAGRPAKLYRRADTQFELTIPPSNPALVSHLLADAIARAGKQADPVRRRLVDVARDAGRAAGGRARAGRSDADRRRALVELLATYGYAPRAAGGALSLTNCPYERLAEQDRDLVCGMNLALIEGAVEGVGLRRTTCSLLPPDSGCCVHLMPWPAPSSGGVQSGVER
jgi:predicted ArsR family transcriptional regulator